MLHRIRSLIAHNPRTALTLTIGAFIAGMYEMSVFEKSRCEEEQRVQQRANKQVDCGLSSMYINTDPFAQESFAQALYARDLCQQHAERWKMDENNVRNAVDAIHLG
jgi:hypothetical protein